MENGTLLETSKEVASERSPKSFQVNDLEPTRGSLPKGNALFESDIWWNRTDLQIEVPQHDSLPTTFDVANVSQPAIDSISAYISSIFNDSSFPGLNLTGAVDGKPNSLNAFQYAPIVMQQLWEASSLDTLFAGLAESITSNIWANADGSVRQHGQLGIAETLIEVRWLWTILPILCTCFGAVSLALAMWHTHKNKMPLWKNSVLALIFHGLEYEAMRSQTNERLLSKIQKDAQNMQVIFGDELALGKALPTSSGT